MTEYDIDNIEDAASEAATLGTGYIAGSAAAAGLSGIHNLINAAESQSAPLGEIFVDKAIDAITKGKDYSILYNASVPRKASDILPGGSLTDFIYNPIANVRSIDRDIHGNIVHPNADSLDFLLSEVKDNLNKELAGLTPPDKLTKFPRLNKMSADQIKSVFNLDKTTHIINSPRNNVEILAHELGHIDGADKLFSPSDNKLVNVIKQTAGRVWKGAYDTSDTWLRHIPLIDKAYSYIMDTKLPNTVRNLVQGSFMSASPLAVATTALAASDSLQDFISDNDPTGLAKGVVDIVKEHPVAAVLAAQAPRTIHEAYTAIPGSKFIYNFWDDINKGILPSWTSGNPELKSLVGKVSPIKETLKFLGRNALPVIGGALPIAGIAAANYYLDNKEN